MNNVISYDGQYNLPMFNKTKIEKICFYDENGKFLETLGFLSIGAINDNQSILFENQEIEIIDSIDFQKKGIYLTGSILYIHKDIVELKSQEKRNFEFEDYSQEDEIFSIENIKTTKNNGDISTKIFFNTNVKNKFKKRSQIYK